MANESTTSNKESTTSNKESVSRPGGRETDSQSYLHWITLYVDNMITWTSPFASIKL